MTALESHTLDVIVGRNLIALDAIEVATLTALNWARTSPSDALRPMWREPDGEGRVCSQAEAMGLVRRDFSKRGG